MAGTLTYLDASALVKLVVAEPETDALRAFLETRPLRVTSVLAAVEVPRAARRVSHRADVHRRADAVVAGMTLLSFDEPVRRRAAALRPGALRTLDAIHLASALSLGKDLEVFLAYDRRLAEAARAARVRVASPA